MVQQSPQTLPPIYNGEKMVVYGIITAEGSPVDQDITGKAVLRGNILGKKIEHSVPFTFNSVSTSSPSLPTIHHLAAKALIKDWQDQDKNKEDIVKLSVESSVISSHTAFIAVDEGNSEPVAGAVKVWDVQARLGYNAISRSSSVYSSNSSDNEFDDDGDEFECDSENEEIAEINSKQKTELNTTMRSSTLVSETFDVPHSATIPVISNTNLNTLIIAQQADGSWKFDSTLTKLVDKPQTVIEGACPSECKGIAAAVWATVLILTLLRKKYSSQQDEWELIAMKAESWVKKQALPSGVTMQDFYEAADTLIL